MQVFLCDLMTMPEDYCYSAKGLTAIRLRSWSH
jgi:hypothetical protein